MARSIARDEKVWFKKNKVPTLIRYEPYTNYKPREQAWKRYREEGIRYA